MTDFVRRFLVHWSDCDPAGIVFHANFIRWMDEGFTELTMARDLSFVRLKAADPAFRGSPLVNVACAFRAPVRFGETLEHRIGPAEFGNGRSFRFQHRFFCDGTLVAEGEQVRIWGMATADGAGLRAVPVPPAVAAKLRGEAV